jgi:hypothetical protein
MHLLSKTSMGIIKIKNKNKNKNKNPKNPKNTHYI